MKTKEDSNLVKHARTEMELTGEDKDTVDGICRVVQAFADMGHSGGSAPFAISTLNRLLKFENLMPLKKIENAPDEWINHSDDPDSPVWQNRRNSRVVNDGTGYYNVDSPGKERFNGPNQAVRDRE